MGKLESAVAELKAALKGTDLDAIKAASEKLNEASHAVSAELYKAAAEKSKAGKGGDLIYRWGNPRAYRAGTVKDQRLFGPHNSHWIAKGLPGEGHVIVFNNGMRRTGGAYSTVDEIVTPVDAPLTRRLIARPSRIGAASASVTVRPVTS